MEHRNNRGPRALAALLAVVIAVMVPSVLAAQAAPSAHDPGWKAGVQLGYPSSLNAGWRLNRDFELNAQAGSRYSHFDVGANALFRIVSLEIEKEPFPVSAGPQVILGLGPDFLGLDVLGVIRIENTLRPVPLNLFIEAGVGLSVFPETTITGMGSIGLRLVFDHPALKTVEAMTRTE